MYLWRAGSGQKSAGTEKLAGPGQRRGPSSGAWGSAEPGTPPPGRRGKHSCLWSSVLRWDKIYFAYVCACVCAQSCPTLWPHGLQPARLLCPWDSPGKNTGVGCHFLFQGNLPDPGIKPALQADSFQLCHLGSSNITLSYSKFMLFHQNYVKLKCKQ